MSKNCDVNSKTMSFDTCLLDAADRGHKEIVEILLKNNSIQIDAKNNYGSTALMCACKRGNTEIVEMLLGHGADVTAQDNDSRAPLMWAIKGSNIEIVQMLLDCNLGNRKVQVRLLTDFANQAINNQNINLQDKNGKTALIRAIKKRCYSKNAESFIEQIVELLVKNGSKLDIKDNGGKTALMHAVRYNDVLEILIENYADIYATDKDNKRAIDFANSFCYKSLGILRIAQLSPNKQAYQRIMAYINKKLEVECLGPAISSLIRLSIPYSSFIAILGELDPKFNDNQNKLVESYSKEDKRNIFELLTKNKNGKEQSVLNKLLIKATLNGHSNLVDLLIKNGVDVNYKNPESSTALHYAIDWKRHSLIDTLLKAGADVNVVNCHRRTPLVYAIIRNDAETIEKLIESGADVKYISFDPKEKNQTLLMFAIIEGKLNAIMSLIRAGIDINVQDSDGRTALMFAVEKNYTGVIEWLLANGADISIKDKKGKTALDYASQYSKEIIKDIFESYIK